ncbi:MAG: cysteine desulfurase [Paludibacteraceae bacterium]|nr:cysteine desulfurase [Paludibacteraceae bacterium]
MAFDIDKIRTEFPLLSRRVYDKRLVYLDNAATTQKPESVLKKIDEGYRYRNANIHRGVHLLSQEATEAHETARKQVATFLNARSADEIVFTRGTTEAINLVAYSFGERFCSEGDEIVLSQMEHHSNIVPWQMLAERKNLRLRVVPINERGELSPESYREMLTERTRLVAVAHVSNVLGTINPIKEIVEIAHEAGVRVLIDGAQAVAHLPVDVQALDTDFYAFSGHKIYAPTGIGVLYGKRELLEAMPPYQGGGEMIKKVTFEKTTYNGLPYKFEAGTPDFISSTALAEALRFVQDIGWESLIAHEDDLLAYATKRLQTEMEDVRIFGTAAHKSGVLSFLVRDIHPYDLGIMLDKLGIALRTGHHCAEPLIDSLGIPGTIRASFALYNTREEVDIFIEALKRAVALF